MPTRVERFNVDGGPNPFFHAAPNQRDWAGSVAYASSPADVAVVTDDFVFTFAVPPGTAMVTAEGWTSPASADQGGDVDSPSAEIVWTLVPPSPMAFNIIGRGTDEEMGTGYLYDRATAPSRPMSECVRGGADPVLVLDPAVQYNLRISTNAASGSSHILESVTFYGST